VSFVSQSAEILRTLLVGVYRFLEEDSTCAEYGCSYSKDGSPGDVYCFRDGDYEAEAGEECPTESTGRLHPVSATQSSLYTNTDFPERYFPAAKCIDGDTESPSHAPPAWNMCHTNGGERSPWLAIDYGSSVTVRRVEIFNREDCCGDRTKNVDVHVSNELPTSANQMFSGGSLLGHFAGPASNGEHIIISGEALSGRYVIVQMDISESDSLHFREVMAFGEKGT